VVARNLFQALVMGQLWVTDYMDPRRASKHVLSWINVHFLAVTNVRLEAQLLSDHSNGI
jgi:hypothetical protein